MKKLNFELRDILKNSNGDLHSIVSLSIDHYNEHTFLFINGHFDDYYERIKVNREILEENGFSLIKGCRLTYIHNSFDENIAFRISKTNREHEPCIANFKGEKYILYIVRYVDEIQHILRKFNYYEYADDFTISKENIE